MLGMVPGMLSEWELPLSGILWDVHMLRSSHCLWLLWRSLSSYSFARSSSHAEYAFPLSSTLILPGRHEFSLYDSSPTIPSLWSPPWWFSSQEMVGMFPQSSICITQLYHLAYHDPGVSMSVSALDWKSLSLFIFSSQCLAHLLTNEFVLPRPSCHMWEAFEQPTKLFSLIGMQVRNYINMF